MNEEFKSAVSLYESGQLSKSKKVCVKILKTNPNHFDSLRLLSIIEYLKKNYQEAHKLINSAIKINSNNAMVYNDKGTILINLKKLEDALKNFDKAIKIKSDYADAYYSRGNVLKDLNRLDQALESFKKVIKINPQDFEAHNNCGNLFFGLKKFNSALVSFDNAIKLNSDYADAHYNRGNVLSELRELEAAVASYDKAIKINPNQADTHKNRGNVLSELRQFDLALESYQRSYAIDPEKDFLFETLFHTRNHLSDWKLLENNKKILKNQILKNNKAPSPFVILSIYDSPSLQKTSAEAYVKKKFTTNDLLEPVINKKQNKKIRIGYYSADFREHEMSSLLINLFELHNKSKFEIYGFSFIPGKGDKMHSRISNTFDKFIDVKLKNEKEIAQLSRDHNIDIAVDLMAFTQHHRFGIFVERCAPIQVNFLGYPGTTGADCIDYIIADKFLIPKESQKYYSEKIVYMPNTYQPNDSKRKISDKVFTKEELGLPKEGFVFCCFNKNYKITPNVFDIWMKILKRVKDSVICIFLEDFNPIAKKNLKEEAKRRNIDSNRIIFIKGIPLSEHLARHKAFDLFIDTFPYTAHTTGSDALWSGLPVLTRIGDSFASRVTGSLSKALELQELITNTEKEYEDLAVELATNPKRLEEIKTKLENNRLAKPLFNTELYTRNIESAFIKMYERYIGNMPIKNIEIK